MTKPCGCCQEAELRTGLVRVELEGGEYFYARRGEEREGKLIFPTPLSPSKTIDVSVEQKIRKIKEVTIQEVLLIMNWEASYRPVVDSKLVENFLTALPLKKKL